LFHSARLDPLKAILAKLDPPGAAHCHAVFTLRPACAINQPDHFIGGKLAPRLAGEGGDDGSFDLSRASAHRLL
jgi:hypothetical protein